MQRIQLRKAAHCASCLAEMVPGQAADYNHLAGTVIHPFGGCPPEAWEARGICATCRGSGRKPFMGLPSAAVCESCWGTGRPLSPGEREALRPAWTYPPDCLGIPEEAAVDEALMRHRGLLDHETEV